MEAFRCYVRTSQTWRKSATPRGNDRAENKLGACFCVRSCMYTYTYVVENSRC